MNSEVQKTYDLWISTNYDRLLVYANRYHRDGHDLLHFVYLKVRDLPNLEHILSGKPWGYHILAMFRQSKMGTFGKEYKILDHQTIDVEAENEFEYVVLREEVDNIIRQLDFFDRTIFELRADGYSMTTLAKESGISVHTIYYSLRKTTKLLRNKLC